MNFQKNPKFLKNLMKQIIRPLMLASLFALAPACSPTVTPSSPSGGGSGEGGTSGRDASSINFSGLTNLPTSTPDPEKQAPSSKPSSFKDFLSGAFVSQNETEANACSMNLNVSTEDDSGESVLLVKFQAPCGTAPVIFECGIGGTCDNFGVMQIELLDSDHIRLTDSIADQKGNPISSIYRREGSDLYEEPVPEPSKQTPLPQSPSMTKKECLRSLTKKMEKNKIAFVDLPGDSEIASRLQPAFSAPEKSIYAIRTTNDSFLSNVNLINFGAINGRETKVDHSIFPVAAPYWLGLRLTAQISDAKKSIRLAQTFGVDYHCELHWINAGFIEYKKIDKKHVSYKTRFAYADGYDRIKPDDMKLEKPVDRTWIPFTGEDSFFLDPLQQYSHTVDVLGDQSGTYTYKFDLGPPTEQEFSGYGGSIKYHLKTRKVTLARSVNGGPDEVSDFGTIGIDASTGFFVRELSGKQKQSVIQISKEAYDQVEFPDVP